MKAKGLNSYRRFTILAILFIFATTIIVSPARNDNDRLRINNKANRAKARHLVETASTMGNGLMAAYMFDIANSVDCNDTVVTLACNNLNLMLSPNGNPLYFKQLELLESIDNPPLMYYYTIIRSLPPQEEDVDSLTFYRTAVKAYNKFPGENLFIANLLERGTSFIYSHRYNTLRGEITDTLALSPTLNNLADTLLAWADTIETRHGYSLTVDRSRALLYTMLDRKDDLRNLAKRIEKRDSTDIETLDLLTSISYNTGDTLGLSRLGLRRFEIVPDPEHVFALYDAMTDDSLRNNLVEVVIEKACNTDIEPDLRMSLLGALAQAYYNDSNEITERTPFLDRINAVVTEITAEDPTDLPIYIQGTVLVSNEHWVGLYGYRHWMNAVDAIADSTTTLSQIAAALVTSVDEDVDFENHLVKLLDYHSANTPHLVLPMKLSLAQYYFNTKKYQKNLDILQPITLDDLRKQNEQAKEFIAAHPDEEQEPPSSPEDTEKTILNQWLLIQTLISESQMNLERVDDALATLNQILVIDPENAGVLNNLAYYMCENGKDLSIALSLAERSLALEPDNLNTIDTHAWIIFKKGDTEKAIKDMERFFSLLNINLFADLVNKDNPEPAIDVLKKTANVTALCPILGHLLIILSDYDKTGEYSSSRIAEVLEQEDPENADLKEYLSTHK